MEKERGFKVIAIIALLVAIVGVGVGFAAYTRNLTISQFTANVTADNTNPFVPSNDALTSSGLILANAASEDDAVKSAGTASNNTWSGISIVFDKDNRSATLTADVENYSSYTAYLKSINIADSLTCAAVNASTTNSTLVTALCNSIEITVGIDTAEATYDGSAQTKITNYSAASSATAGNVAAMSGSTAGTKTINLEVSIGSDITLPDGDVTISVPTITFGYSSVEN